jgi:hypothetical protein
MNRVSRRREVARSRARAFWLTGMCIAAFEGSQLVNYKTTSPDWTEVRALIASDAAVRPSQTFAPLLPGQAAHGTTGQAEPLASS